MVSRTKRSSYDKHSRCLQTTLAVTNQSINVFTDASYKIYGATTYQQCL